ncbi:hypothetical protein [Neglectibacter timonensis]|uniref:hypothetical protein n=1 Tax=Neglectibacter timonensis TaxID=1776382 RepID=UPI00266BE4FC|nr:hypothetical protein [Neglectibacter timonensis]
MPKFRFETRRAVDKSLPACYDKPRKSGRKPSLFAGANPVSLLDVLKDLQPKKAVWALEGATELLRLLFL